MYQALIPPVACGALLAAAALLSLHPQPHVARGPDLSQLPLAFEPNQGQAGKDVRFVARTPDSTLSLGASAASFRFPASRHTSLELNLRFAGANPHPSIRGVHRLPGRSHYFLGSDATRWRRNIPLYAAVRYDNLYPGVSLQFYGSRGELEYDLIVAPGADPHVIRLAFEGTWKPRVDSQGDIVLSTPLGDVRHRKPRVYQDGPTGRRWLEGRYATRGGVFAIELAEHDPRLPLVIDPVVVYSACVPGGELSLQPVSVAVDRNGYIYLAGQASSGNSPYGAGIGEGGRGQGEVVVTKLNPSGTELVYSAYFGGTGEDSARAITVDQGGNAVVAGYTNSPDFPVVKGTQSMIGGGGNAAFRLSAGGWKPMPGLVSGQMSAVVRAGTDLFAGGAGGVFRSADNGAPWLAMNRGIEARTVTSLAVHPTHPTNLLAITDRGLYRSTDGGNTWLGVPSFYFVGYSVTFDPADPNVAWMGTYDLLLKSTDAGDTWTEVALPNTGAIRFLIIDPKNSAMMYAGSSTALHRSDDGGTTWSRLNLESIGQAYLYALAADPTNPENIYLATGAGLFKSNDRGSTWVAFGAGMTYSRSVMSLAVAPSNTQVVYAATSVGTVFKTENGGASWVALSTGLPGYGLNGMAVNPADPNDVVLIATVARDAFVARLDSSGGTLLYSTFLGGTLADEALAVAADPWGNAFVAGSAGSRDFPLNEPLQAPPGGAVTGSAFVAKFDAEGGRLFSTYVAGRAASIAADQNGYAYLAGTISSAALPVSHALQEKPGGGGDAFVAKLGPGKPEIVFATFLGGSKSDAANGIALDAAGNIYVTGQTASPELAGATAGGSDAFVAKLSNSGDRILYFKLIGGSKDDLGSSVAVDSSGVAHIAGQTYSQDLPLRNAWHTSFGTYVNAFAAAISPDGGELVYSGALSDRYLTNAWIAVDPMGAVYFAGTSSNQRDCVINDPDWRSRSLFVMKVAGGKVVSAACPRLLTVAPEGLAAVYGDRFSSDASASEVALPSLGGVSVRVIDSAGSSEPAGIVSVSPGRVDFLVPAGSATGPATVAVTREDGSSISAPADIAQPAPALFSVDGNGAGIARGEAVLDLGYGTGSYSQPFAQYDAVENAFVATPLFLEQWRNQLSLVFYGTGFRRCGLSDLRVRIGDQELSPTSLGAYQEQPGVDRVAVAAGGLSLWSLFGDVEVRLVAGSAVSNPVTIRVAYYSDTMPPVIRFVSPTRMRGGQWTNTFTVGGWLPKDPASIQIRSDQGLTLKDVKPSLAGLSGTLSVARDAAPGIRDVTVTTASQRSNSLPLEILPAGSAPHISNFKLLNVHYDESKRQAGVSAQFDFEDADGDIVWSPSGEGMSAAARFDATMRIADPSGPFGSTISKNCKVEGSGTYLNRPNRTSGTITFTQTFEPTLISLVDNIEVRLTLRDSAQNVSNVIRFNSWWYCY